jgi:proton-translocating NADH-quinone oxidoreductase chain N
LFAFLYIFIFCIFFSNINVYKYSNITRSLIFIFLLVFFLYIILSINSIDFNFVISYYFFVSNELTFFLRIFFVFLSSLILLFFYSFLISFDILFFEFVFLYILSCLGMLLLIMSYDFIIVYLSIELQSLCFYILIAIQRKRNKAVEAGLKYFILGSFSSTVFLLGIGFIYGATGVTNFKDLALLLNFGLNFFLPSDFFFFFGLLLICIGFFFKLSIAPFHFWLPDVFDGSSRLVISIFGILPKFSIFFLFFKICSILFSQFFFILQFFFLFFVLFSWIIGLLGAIKTNRLNKFLAYSSINHLGFILLGLLINDLFSVIFYLFVYVLISLNIFVIFCSLLKANNKTELSVIEQLLYIKKSNLILVTSLCVALLSLAGVPPLAGFFGKFFVFLSAILSNFYFLTITGLFISLISCFYYLRIIKFLSFNNTKNFILLSNLDKVTSYLLSLGIVFNCCFIFVVPFFYNFIKYLFLISFF